MLIQSAPRDLDPLALVASHPDRYPALFESGARRAARERGSDREMLRGSGSPPNCRFDILPVANGERLVLRSDGTLSGRIGGKDKFFAALDAWWRELAQPRDAAAAAAEIPFAGGWIVYLGYEMAGEIEPRLRLPRSPLPVIALALRAPAAWIYDRQTGSSTLIAEDGAESLIGQFRRDHTTSKLGPLLGSAIDMREEAPVAFITRTRRALDYIAAGDIYQANLSRPWRSVKPAEHSAADLYRRLCRANPAPFAALLRDADFSVVSSSPERLLAVEDGIVHTRPIAGTRPRGATMPVDRELAEKLLANEKERAEHVMLIDLERNDLGKVCCGGTVEVDEFMTVESYTHVHHIVSNVRGRLRPELTPIDALRAVFPGGTITGCPKVRCMEIIAELEAEGRGAYTGSVGYLGRDGRADFNILIRTITSDARGIEFRAGAGIVADSDPEREVDETRAKALGLLKALDACS
jgi:anthranilate synthase component I